MSQTAAPRPDHARSGAALIIAMTVLVMLLLLGLPFLISQTADVTGTTHFRNKRLIDEERRASEQLALALGAYANAVHLVNDPARGFTLATRTYSQFGGDLALFQALWTYQQAQVDILERWNLETTDDGTVVINPDAGAISGTEIDNLRLQGLTGRSTTTRSSLYLSDESGRLNINDCDELMVHQLLQAIRAYDGSRIIPDWDDNLAWDSHDRNGNDPVDDDPGDPDLDIDDDHNEIWELQSGSWVEVPDTNTDGDDSDNQGPSGDTNWRTGELAEAMARLRYIQPSGRLDHVQQLLEADTGHWLDPGDIDFEGIINPQYQEGPGNTPPTGTGGAPPTGTYGTNADVDASRAFGLRAPLSDHELETLQPTLTTESTAQGRRGFTDLGTIIAKPPNSAVIDADIGHLIGRGTNLIGLQPAEISAWYDTSALPHQWRSSGSLTGIAEDHKRRGSSPSELELRSWIGIDLPSVVNINTAPADVVNALTGGWSGSLPIVGLRNLAAQNSSLDPSNANRMLALLDPLGTGRERPPIGLLSWGLIRAGSGASANDFNRYRIGRDVDNETYEEWLAQEALLGPRYGQQQKLYGAIVNADIYQALPPEEILERRWDQQSRLHTLVVGRHTNGLVSWPTGINRQTDGVPEEDPLGTSRHADTGLRARPVRTIVDLDAGDSMPWVPRRWTRSFVGELGGNNDEHHILAAGIGAKAPVQPALPIDPATSDLEVRPDGIAIGDDGLGWKIIPGNPDQSPLIAVNPHNGVLDYEGKGIREIQGHQLDFWFCPTEDWSDTDIDNDDNEHHHICHIGPRANAVPTTNDPSCYRIYYDADHEYLVLEIGNAAVPAIGASGINAPYDNHSPEKVDIVDDASLGLAGTATSDIQPGMPIWGQRIRHLYKVIGGLQKDRWYHLQAIVAHSKPGGLHLILDSLVGRDARRLPAGEPLRTGDHQTLPSVVLDEPIAGWDGSDGRLRGKHLHLPNIQLRSTNIIKDITSDGNLTALQKVLPGRGVVLIGDEHIRYEALNNSGQLTNCLRGMRTNTWNVYDPANSRDLNIFDEQGFPSIQEHLAGDTVMPSGVRLTYASNNETGPRIYTGGTRLVDELANDDLLGSDGSHYTRGTVNISGTGVITTDGSGTPEAFPSAFGLIAIRDEEESHIKYVVYEAYTYNATTGIGTFTNLHDAMNELKVDNNADDEDDYIGGVPYDWPIMNPGDSTPRIQLIGLRCESDVTNSEQFQQNGDALIQVTDSTSNRIEWIGYDHTSTVNHPTAGPLYYFVSRTGFRSSGTGKERGRERTPLPSSNFLSPFPALSQVLPVQTQAKKAYQLATGDFVTFHYNRYRSGLPPTIPPKTAVVRHAPVDGFNFEDTPASEPIPGARDHDVKNEYFALDRALGGTSPDCSEEGFSILVWPCWGGIADLSGNSLSETGLVVVTRTEDLMPGIDAFSPTYDANTSAPELVFGRNPNGTASNIVVDKINSATLPWQRVGLNSVRRTSRLKDDLVNGRNAMADKNDSPLDILTAETADWADNPIKILPEGNWSSLNGQAHYGLMLLDDEVIAVERTETLLPSGDTQMETRIVGRGLLGSQITEHRVRTTFLNHYTGPRAPATEPLANFPSSFTRHPTLIPLPLGPIAVLEDSLPADAFGSAIAARPYSHFDNQSPPNAQSSNVRTFFPQPPMALLMKSDGSAHEIAHLRVRGEGFYTAPWLRGLYHTTPRNFESGDLVMGWWPRFLPHLPDSSHPAWSDADNAQAMFSCRSLQWAGIPLRFRQMRPADPVDKPFELLDTITVPVDPATGDGLVDVYTRALPPTINWSTAHQEALSTPGNESQVFADGGTETAKRFIGVDGVEVRMYGIYDGDAVVSETSDSFAFTDPTDASRVLALDRAQLNNPTNPDDDTSAANFFNGVALRGNTSLVIPPFVMRAQAPSLRLDTQRQTTHTWPTDHEHR